MNVEVRIVATSYGLQITGLLGSAFASKAENVNSFCKNFDGSTNGGS